MYWLLSVDSIKCWVCRSDGDPKCADPFDNTSFPIADCRTEQNRDHLPGLDPTMCRKVRQKGMSTLKAAACTHCSWLAYSVSVNGNWRYLRSCAWLGEPGVGRDERYCIHRSGTYNIHVEYCTCRSKDGCNAGVTFKPQAFMLLLLPFITVSAAKAILLPLGTSWKQTKGRT